ncbi:iridovirus major capsid protein [Acanthamoeba castellanii str. Neff]|uniref:Iridovirus major capsid protein n=1 Tax=Acanthamoeba castellanii (strain ATCC 30010 / Neff) TaxID=1257118 RepID=L8GRM6_ACACF|nr:iridovirus major capsid protein [Acanthamoeba castellanii str. Neff]ELR15834.1 iridovirus major capsid protein [Acanthamoeba castellanii str. Neff]
MLEQVTLHAEKKLGDQVGQADTREQLIDYGKRTQHIYFDWNRHTEHALPLIALQYHDGKINVRTRRAEELIVRSGEANNPATLAQPGDMCEMTLLLNYVFLDAMERRMFAQQMHEYLVDEVQHSSSESHTAGVSSQHVRLNFNHPVKELLWVVQRDSAITPTPYTGPGALAGGGGNDWFNWSGQYDAGLGLVFDPIASAELQLNGHPRTLEHPAQYYRTVHPREKHTSKPSGFIYNYSFALYPEDKQPSGSCNFSRIDNVTLRLIFPNAYNAESAAHATPFNGQIRVYAPNHNYAN